MGTAIPGLYASAPEPLPLAARASNLRAAFSQRHVLDTDVEVIPGHTSGATACLWDSGAVGITDERPQRGRARLPAGRSAVSAGSLRSGGRAAGRQDEACTSALQRGGHEREAR